MPQTRYIRYVPSEIAIKRIGRIHTFLYRLSRGRIGNRIDGLDILLLTTTGKKSGQKRTVPLPYFRDGARYLLIASFGGNAKNPAWVGNVASDPNVTIHVDGKKLRGRASAADPSERDRLWHDITTEHPRYLNYQAKTERKIPIVVIDVN